jgi:hypothetical protein
MQDRRDTGLLSVVETAPERIGRLQLQVSLQASHPYRNFKNFSLHKRRLQFAVPKHYMCTVWYHSYSPIQCATLSSRSWYTELRRLYLAYSAKLSKRSDGLTWKLHHSQGRCTGISWPPSWRLVVKYCRRFSAADGFAGNSCVHLSEGEHVNSSVSDTLRPIASGGADQQRVYNSCSLPAQQTDPRLQTQRGLHSEGE